VTYPNLRAALAAARRLANRSGRRIVVRPLYWNPWRTLHGARTFLGDDGRIVHGLAPKFHGVHVRDLGRVERRERRISREAQRAIASSARARGGSYRRKRDYLESLLGVNPALREFLEATAKDRHPHNLDSFTAYLERPRVASWYQALGLAVPGKGRFADVGRSPKLRAFAQAAEGAIDWPGGRIVAPIPEGAAALDPQTARHEILDQKDRAVADLYELARRERLARRRVPLPEAPF